VFNCVVAVAQNSVCSDPLQSSKSHYRKQLDHALSKEKPRKRITMMFNVSFGNFFYLTAFIFYRAMLSRVPLCHSMSSVCPSVCLYDVEVPWSHGLEYFKNNLKAE